jgi:drug/metabolite transporter (DMT)-like permease
LAALITVIIWGVSFVASKAALGEGMSPVSLIFTRFAIGTAILTFMLHLRGDPLLPPREHWLSLALMGFVGIFAHHMLQATGLTKTTAINTGWLIGVIPIWSAVLSAIVHKERFGIMKTAGLLGGFAGAILVITRGRVGADLLKLSGTKGDLLILASTVTWAVYTVIGHDTLRRLGPTRATAGAMLFGWLMLAPFFVADRGWEYIARLSPIGWLAILFLGIGCSAIGYLFWYGALERIEVSRVAAFLYIEPLVTLVAAVILLGEKVTPTTIIGGLIVLGSVFVIQHAPAATTTD